MKSFHQFITEAYDKELEGQASRAPGEEGRIRAARKKREIERTRKKAEGGGKTGVVKDYKTRKDAGTNKPRSEREQQPEGDRHAQQLSPRERQKERGRKQLVVERLRLLKIIRLEKMLVQINLNQEHNSNQHKQEEVLLYQQGKHNVRQQWREEQVSLVEIRKS